MQTDASLPGDFGGRKPRPLEIAATIGAVFLGGVLLLAALTKLIDPDAFAELIRHEGLDFVLPAKVVALLAIALEVGLGVALVSGIRRTWVLGVATGLVVFFLFLTGRNYVQYVRGDVDASGSCGCFGSLVERTPAEAFWWDVLLLVPALVLAWFERPAGTGWALPRGRGIATGAAAALALVFALLAPSLPLDGIATKLSEGRRVEDICVGKGAATKRVCLRDVIPDLPVGRHVVAIVDLEDPGFKESVPKLNEYALEALDGKRPPLWVVTAATSEAIEQFKLLSGAAFGIRESPPSFTRALYRRLPRSFLVEDGVVKTTWAGLPPLESLTASASR